MKLEIYNQATELLAKIVAIKEDITTCRYEIDATSNSESGTQEYSSNQKYVVGSHVEATPKSITIDIPIVYILTFLEKKFENLNLQLESAEIELENL